MPIFNDSLMGLLLFACREEERLRAWKTEVEADLERKTNDARSRLEKVRQQRDEIGFFP